MKLSRLISSSLVAAIVLVLLPSCVEPPPGSESQIWQRPPRYGHGGTESSPSLPGQKGKSNPKTKGTKPADSSPTGGRFGFNGDNANAPDNQPENEPAATTRDRESTAATNPEKPADPPKEEKKPGGAPSVSQMPFAKGVPGKPLSVTLPGSNGSLGEISIEQYEGGKPSGKPLPPGTPVEIPDPNNPGKKIYFRVP